MLQALGVEAVLGGCLALANCASWDARNRLLVGSWPMRIGLIVTALSLAAVRSLAKPTLPSAYSFVDG